MKKLLIGIVFLVLIVLFIAYIVLRILKHKDAKQIGELIM